MIDSPISSVVGAFPTEAALEDAVSRLTLAGFDRAALSLPTANVPAGEAAPKLDAEPVNTEVDRQQARTLGTSMSGAVAGMAAAGATIATGGAAAAALLAAAGVGGVAAAVTATITRGRQEGGAEERQAAASLGQLTLSVRVLSPDQQMRAEAVLREAGATLVTAQPADHSVTTEGNTI